MDNNIALPLLVLETFGFMFSVSFLHFFLINNRHKSLFINISDILLSMLFNLLLSSITVLLCYFFLFLVVFYSFFTIPVEIQNERLKLALSIPTGAPKTVGNDAIEILSVVKLCKTINDLSK